MNELIKSFAGLSDALGAFAFGDEIAGVLRYGAGHINDTFAVYTQEADGDARRFILQRLNTDMFKRPVEVMENIAGVTGYLRRRITEAGGDPDRETLNLIPTTDGALWYTDPVGGFWRCFPFIEETLCLQQVEKPEDFYESAKSFGNFMRQLEGYPAATLHETIAKFHDTPDRLAKFEAAVRADSCHRADGVQAEIDFILHRRADCSHLTDLLQDGLLPLRVTHNDTKLNNILLDKATGKGLCIIDLDTIMPGLAAYDFGDSIRFGASTAAEDETDLSKVTFSLPLYELYVKGYLEAAGSALTAGEKAALPWGAKLMTLECGMRFLTDYLSGDSYFKTSRPGQNLDRTRTQLALVAQMEANWAQMNAIVARYGG